MEVRAYNKIIQKVLAEYAAIPYRYGEVAYRTVFDDTDQRYLLMAVGWENGKRVHSPVIHIEIIDDKVWIEANNTDQSIAEELIQYGIPQSAIVLGMQPAELRPLTKYAIG